MMVYTYLVTVWRESDDGNPSSTISDFQYSIFADSGEDRMALRNSHLSFPNYSQLKKAVLVHAHIITFHEQRLISEHARRSSWDIRYLWVRDLIDPMKPSHGILEITSPVRAAATSLIYVLDPQPIHRSHMVPDYQSADIFRQEFNEACCTLVAPLECLRSTA
jgi:hypothetical protein